MGYLSAFLSPFLVVVFSTGDGFNNINRSLHAWRFCFLKLLTVVCYERRGVRVGGLMYARGVVDSHTWKWRRWMKEAEKRGTTVRLIRYFNFEMEFFSRPFLVRAHRVLGC